MRTWGWRVRVPLDLGNYNVVANRMCIYSCVGASGADGVE